ncbi:MAG: hypothetical protein O6933_06115 [Planctomycetota bacterium]|nr:hypothetical protein [Planctomycetota bacterium]
MTGYPGTDWPWWIGGTALGVFGLVLMWWALLHDRAKGRRRCPKCWYDMTGAERLRCPECGHLAKRERKLFTTRRRWRWAVVALLMMFAGRLGIMCPQIQRDGWWSLVSNAALIYLLVFVDDASGLLAGELLDRMEADELSVADWERFFDRVVSGDWRARPTSTQWENKYYEIVRKWRFANLSTKRFRGTDHKAYPAEQKLYALPAQIQLQTRDPWPEGLPVYIAASWQTWWPLEVLQLLVQPQIPEAETVELYDGVTVGRRGLFLPFTEPMKGVVTFDVTVLQLRGEEDDLEWIEVGTEVIEVPVRIAGKLDEIMTPVQSPQMDQILRDELQLNVIRFTEAGFFDVWPSVWVTNTPLFDGIALGLVTEFLLDGEVVAGTTYWWEGGARTFDAAQTANPYWGDFQRLARMRSEENWTARLRGDAEVALRVVGVDKYWSGQVTIPITLDDPDEPEPVPAADMQFRTFNDYVMTETKNRSPK